MLKKIWEKIGKAADRFADDLDRMYPGRKGTYSPTEDVDKSNPPQWGSWVSMPLRRELKIIHDKSSQQIQKLNINAEFFPPKQDMAQGSVTWKPSKE